MLVGPAQEALERAVDEPRIAFMQGGIREAELVQRAWPEVLGQHIAALEEAQDQVAALGVLEVDGEALLVAVEDREEAGAGMFETPRVVAFQRLDFDHFGAEIGEHQATRGAHHHVRELDNAHTLKQRHGILWAGRRAPYGRTPVRREWRPP